MSLHDTEYFGLLRSLVYKAETLKPRPDRTGTGTTSIFGSQLTFDLTSGFPLLTTKKVHIKSVIHELLWFLKGDTNIKYLKEHGVSIWDEWATPDGELGDIYGAQWRHWGNDQIASLIRELKEDPYSRRHIVSAWNVDAIPSSKLSPQDNVRAGLMALAPCHTMWQVYIDDRDESVSLKLYQRSADYFLGVPFNIASYALLTHMIAHNLGRPVDRLIITFGDCHLYCDHLAQAKQQLGRSPYSAAPTLNILCEPKDLWDYTYEDFEILNYNPAPAIKAPISI